MNELKAGDKIRTTEAYFKQLNRRVYGVLIENHNDFLCLVLVHKQEGDKAIPEYTGSRVLMSRRDLEKDDAK